MPYTIRQLGCGATKTIKNKLQLSLLWKYSAKTIVCAAFWTELIQKFYTTTPHQLLNCQTYTSNNLNPQETDWE